MKNYFKNSLLMAGLINLLYFDFAIAEKANTNFSKLLSETVETGKFLADDGAEIDHYGIAVSMSGNRVAIGASRHDTVEDVAGAVYVYQFDGNQWNFEQKLIADDGAASDQFGQAVSIDGERIVVGAFRDDDNNGDSGSAYVFDFNNNTQTWQQSEKLLAADGQNNDWFAYALSLRGDRIAIGARNNAESADKAGAVYVFKYNGLNWIEEQKLLAGDGSEDSRFGQSVSLTEQRVLVGAFGHVNDGENIGAAYVFDYDTGLNSWIETQKLEPSLGVNDGYFGYTVSLSGDLAVVGAHQEAGSLNVPGAAYVYGFDGTSWHESDRLVADDLELGEDFGIAVSAYGKRVLIGASKERLNGFNSGSAYVFDYIHDEWQMTDKLIGSDTLSRDEFGTAVSLDGGNLLVGAYRDDDQGSDSGAAFAFTVPFKIVVNIEGLAAGNTIVLQNNNTDELMADENGLLQFETSLFVGESYTLEVTSQPTTPNQTCTIKQANGVVSDNGVEIISVTCVVEPYLIAGAVEGLLQNNNMRIQNNSDEIQVNSNGPFVFDLPVDDEQNYNVFITKMPNDPIQPCQILNGQGDVQGQDVNDVFVVCETGDDIIFYAGFESLDN